MTRARQQAVAAPTVGSVRAAAKVPRRRGPGIAGLVPRPFVKWVGGKGQLVERIAACAPGVFGSYFEPFIGGGAVFFALFRAGRLAGKRVRLSDVNRELIDTYQALRDDVDGVIAKLRLHRYDRDEFYAVRAQAPASLSPTARAARMIYLNRTGFNGLYRVNSRGQFNVPFGTYRNPMICDEANLRAVSAALAGVELECEPFERVLDQAARGDLVYFDPPYVPVSRTANFTAYARGGFGEPEQERLAAVVEQLAARKTHVLESNSDTPWVRARYAAFTLVEVQASRSVNSRADARGPVGEVIIVGGSTPRRRRPRT